MCPGCRRNSYPRGTYAAALWELEEACREFWAAWLKVVERPVVWLLRKLVNLLGA